ncbi:Gfo/Idh/MocA family oxidoreductase [Roseiarcaceae bacterium H3SJ34-1]|uniref:Gfo/Idh/MocA family protein n=1 Tax=Terripilifer ovatus TaxID=3032367 RepID=UPI003AB95D3F|nr:Gfo/Idh/MocA family oxidoreductase [Roseiarcaceae bacterium H3SJ34-1]
MKQYSIPRLRAAMIGCGAIAELGHLPGAQVADFVDMTVLVDPDIQRAREMCKKFGVAEARSSISEIGGLADMAIVAVPHKVHADVTIDLLERGLHVFIEKPLAVTADEGRRMLAAANAAGRVLGIAMARRFSAGNAYAKKVVESGIFGRPRSFRFEEGGVYSWPSRVPFLLEKDAGSGVLIGSGSHMFDLVLWIFGPVESVRCFTDSRTKQEVDALVELTMASGANGVIELSRSRQLSNSTSIVFDTAVLHVPTFGPGLCIESQDGTFSFIGEPRINDRKVIGDADMAKMMAAQLDDFAEAVALKREPMASAMSGIHCIELIEKCYENQQDMIFPWERPIAVVSQ